MPALTFTPLEEGLGVSRDPSPSANGASLPTHTPGPWQNGFDDLEGICAPDFIGEGNVICLPPEVSMEQSLSRWPANARLIAAAPDLLEALRTMLAETRALGRYVSDETEALAEDAIAKATSA